MSVGKLSFAKAWLLKRPWAVAVAVVAAALVLLAIGHTFRRSWAPSFDNATIWMSTWDVGTRATPLTGPPSRFGWHHPGPLLFYSLAPPLKLSGGLPSALLAGMLLVNLASAIGIVVLAARSAGTAAALVLALATAVLCACYGDRLIDPWNPHTVVLPFALFLVAAWLACAGDAVAAPIAVVAGTFAAQSHLGAVPPVAIVGASAVLLRAIGKVPLPLPARGWRFWCFTVGLTLALWAPLVIDQLNGGGNLARLLHFFRDPASGPALGFGKGALIAGYELLPWGPWLGRERQTLFTDLPVGHWWELAASFAPLLIALVLALRFRDGLAVRLAGLGIAAILACAVAHAQTRGAALGYLTLWSRSIAMLIAAAPLVVLARRYAARVEPWLRSDAVRLAGVAIVGSTIGIRGMLADVPTPAYSRAYERIVKSALDAFPKGTTVRVVNIGAPLTASAEAIVVGLERAGRSARVEQHRAFEMGVHRTVSNQDSVPTLMLVFGIAIANRPKPGVGTVVDQYDPLSILERREVEMLREKLERDLRAGGREDLVQPLRDGANWVWMSMPGTVDSTELGRYLALASGIEKLPWALYALPPGPW